MGHWVLISNCQLRSGEEGRHTLLPAFNILSSTVALPNRAADSNSPSLRRASSSSNGLISTRSHFPYAFWNERRCIVELDIRFLHDAVDLLDFTDLVERALRSMDGNEFDRWESGDVARSAMADRGELSLIRGGVGPSCSSPTSAEWDWDSSSTSAMPDWNECTVWADNRCEACAASND